MDNKEANRSCQHCGKPLGAKAIQGLCPACLLQAGLPTATGGDSAPGKGFTPPAIKQLAGLFPQLEILELIGQGGMGAVYKARQPELDRFVALKVLAPKDQTDPGFAERFTREARALARLNHPNIVAVYEFGHKDNLHFFIMEYVDGPNLRHIQKAGQLHARETLEIIPQICEALQFAHDEGVVHRDIKPENVLLDQKGRVKIADFGLAKIMGKKHQDFTLTQAGHVMGTPHYMAPEQVEHPQDVDHRADIYSLGVVFYEMLTGELPLGKFAPPSRKVQVDVRLDEVVLRTLEKEPDLRYQQASQVGTEVHTIATTAGIRPTDHVLKTSSCYVSTPEHLRTFKGRFLKICQGKGELRLDSEALSFQSGWQMVTIPLSSIGALAQGNYPITAKPLPLNYMAVTFDQDGATRTLLFTPFKHEGVSVQKTNEVVDQWLSALREAVRNSTGRTISVERLDVDQDRFWGGMIKTFVVSAVACIPGFALIPILLEHRLPNRLSEILPAVIVAAFVTGILFAMRWWRSRSAWKAAARPRPSKQYLNAKLIPLALAVLGVGLLYNWVTEDTAGQFTQRLPGQDNAPSGIKGEDEQGPIEGQLVEFDGRPGDLSGAWPGFRGRNFDAVSKDKIELARTWPEQGPDVLWSVDVGEGHAGAAVLNGRVYILDYDRENQADVVRCLSLEDGKDIWRYSYPVKIKRNHGMSRTVPAVTDKYVVTIGPKCHVTCLDSTTGQFRWMLNLVQDFKTKVPPWYAGQCPLIDDDKAIIAPGGDSLVVAVDCNSGEVVWKSPNPNGWKMTHSSIMPMEFGGKKTYVYCASGGVVGISAADGAILWQYDQWRISIANVPSPVVIGEELIFLSGGYNAGSVMLQLTEQNDTTIPEVLFRLEADVFGSPQHSPIFHEGYIYGVRPDGQFACLDTDGRVIWTSSSADKFGLGPYTIANGLIYVMNNSGLLTLAEATPTSFKKLAQAEVLEGPDSWGPMAVVSGRLILRDLNRMICLNIAAQ